MSASSPADAAADGSLSAVAALPPSRGVCYVTAMDVAAALENVRAAAARKVGLRALLLFGSRARGDAAATGDWDFGYLADDGFDPMELRATLVRLLATDNVDLVDLSAASGLLRFRAARDGLLVWGDPSLVTRFRIEAASFWCEAEPILRPAYDAVLERL